MIWLGFKMQPNVTGRPHYHPAILLKVYVYGYLNRVQSSRRLEREARRDLVRSSALKSGRCQLLQQFHCRWHAGSFAPV